MRITTLILAVAVAAGCQGATACQGTTATTTTAATSQAAKATTTTAPQPEIIPPYSPEAFQKIYREGKYSQAQTMCRGAIEEIEKSRGDKSHDLAMPLNDLSMVYLRLAKYYDAQAPIERADAILDKSKPEDSLIIGRLSVNKGWRLYSLGDVRAAEKIFIQARDLIQQNHKEDTHEVAELINNIALMYEDSEDPAIPVSPRRLAQAKNMLLKAWEMRKKLAGEESPECQESLNNIGMHYLFHGQGDDDLNMAVTTLKKSLEMAEKVYGKEHPETAMAHVNLATALQLTNDEAGAEENLKTALPMTEKFLGKDHPDRGYELELLGDIEQGRGNLAVAKTNYLEMLRIYELTYGKNHPHVAHPLKTLLELYDQMGDETKVKETEKRIEKLEGKEI